MGGKNEPGWTKKGGEGPTQPLEFLSDPPCPSEAATAGFLAFRGQHLGSLPKLWSKTVWGGHGSGGGGPQITSVVWAGNNLPLGPECRSCALAFLLSLDPLLSGPAGGRELAPIGIKGYHR